MARLALRLPANVPGDFFVDESCIDCDACRQIAPTVFAQRGEQSAVIHQPESPEETLAAEKALLACPTASIGTERKHDLRAAIASYPEPIADGVHRCGFTSESSFGAFSYLIVRDAGNVLVDSPRFNAPLARNIEAKGGVDLMVLTHIDDVADHAKFRERFGCERLIHQRDAKGSVRDVERKISGDDPVDLGDGLTLIPTPGHTRGHVVYLYRDRFLFTGDHLWWSPNRNHLVASRSACWYSWEEQTKSMERLREISFEWVLPGHGRPVQLPAARMREELERCIEWMKRRE
ncbi:MAG TPA: MBL fold metallo-hydrolase [Thermoanaerobaculia bacterium]|nr:MBL fold metallo-hydrolase [Thermoanaerobaculia bacterium]